MTVVGGLGLHRRQITFDVLDTDTGQLRRGRIAPAQRESLRDWLTQFADQHLELAVEGCTGWRFVVEELQRAGVEAHLAEPGRHRGRARAETAGQDRPGRRPSAARAARGGAITGVVDRAGTDAGDA